MRFAQLYLTDLYRGAVIISGLGVLGAIVGSMIWMVVLRYLAGCVAWTAIVLVNLLAIAGTILCFQKAGRLGWGAVGEVSVFPPRRPAPRCRRPAYLRKKPTQGRRFDRPEE
jgi:hypothetical protein